MADHPAPQPAEAAALLHEHGGRWQIEHTGLSVWTAVRKSPDGRHISMLVAHDLTGLRGKLADAEAEEPADLPAPGVAQPGGGWISGASNPPA
jgi:hypothetical protein